MKCTIFLDFGWFEMLFTIKYAYGDVLWDVLKLAQGLIQPFHQPLDLHKTMTNATKNEKKQRPRYPWICADYFTRSRHTFWVPYLEELPAMAVEYLGNDEISHRHVG